MNLLNQYNLRMLEQSTRRHFLGNGLAGLGALWLSTNTGAAVCSAATADQVNANPMQSRKPQFAPKAKRIIHLHLAGAPSQLELFDHKPELDKLDGEDCPAEFLEGRRFAFIRGVPKLLGSLYPFHQTGQAGFSISDRLPHFEKVVDKVCFVRTMRTDQFNHAPAQLLANTGNANLGYASMGAWVTYGLGTENQDLPGYVVLISGGRTPDAGKSVWGSGFLPSVYQGVQCRSHGPPVLYLDNPDGMSRDMRGKIVRAINRINREEYEQSGDPEITARIAQYEMAYRMQMAASDAMDISKEPQHIHELYGTELGKESFANNCLLARRLVERDVRYVQLFDWGWDSHGASEQESLNKGFKTKCQQIDQPVAALLTDLEQQGLLEDTLVIWASEFGRTPMRENRAGREMELIGRDHHADAFTIWMAGGGVKNGYSYGETDPIGFSSTTDSVNVRDLHATVLHLMGYDHTKLVYRFQGLDQKLTGVQPARVLTDILA